MDDPDIMLTNDDGIDAAGLHALREQLETVGSVTVVAPAEDQSAAGRSHSDSVTVHEHDLGYAVEGLPVDCVLAGLHSLCPETDLVVAGCNRGGNLGAGLLGRSGTVSAAVEAAFLDVPAMAVSMYVPVDDDGFENIHPGREDYEDAVRAAQFLADRSLDAGVFERADSLNVTAPVFGGNPAPMRVTRPSDRYVMDAVREGDQLRLRDRIWDLMAENAIEDEPGTDRHAVLDGAVSVSPLSAPHSAGHQEDLRALAEEFSEG